MPDADLVLKRANVITMDPRQPYAGLVAIKGDRISLVAGNQELVTGTRVIDCRGKTVVPGFNDAHCHLFSFIRKQSSLDLGPPSLNSISDIKAAISRRARNTPPGQWLSGTGYNEFYLAEKRHPTRRDIDEAAPRHPVVLTHRSLHACVLNSLALSLAGITAETPDPPGGLIDRDLDTGEPTGLLFEMLGYIREKVMPPLTEDELARGMAMANEHYLSQGITSLQDATISNDPGRWQTLRRVKEAGKLKSRISMMFGMESLGRFQEAGLASGSGDSQLRLGGVKIVLEEATGQLYPPQPELDRQVLQAHRAGFQVAIHAIEQSALEAAITALEYARSRLPRARRRHRIEHCSQCPPRLLERLSQLQPVVVTQPPFLFYSGQRYLATVSPARLPWLYRIRSLFDAGLVVAGSSDSPIAPANPLVGIYAAVTRKAESGEEVLSREAVSPAQALAMYTINAAHASCEEGIKGSITPGKLADMVVLSDDPTTSPPQRIKDIKVEMAIIGGEVVWETH
ncbi:MAG: amidohydrolase [Chloroflexi bacterium]|nr:amidohydrolase [Chloroflexota bacterium]